MAYVHEAAEGNYVEELGRLLDEDPELIEAKLYERSPLFYACGAGSVAAARLLLDHGADMNRRDDLGLTPLMLACHEGRVEVVSLLLHRGADPLLRAKHGLTALMEASYGHDRRGADNVAVIRLLIKDGRVPVDARDDDGRTALWRACDWGCADRARVLLVEGLADHTIANDQDDAPMAVARREGARGCIRLLEWYEGELHRAFLLSKARAVVDATLSISKAAEKVGTRTRGEAQRARVEAAPAYLRGRVERGKALPVVEVVERATYRSYYRSWDSEQLARELAAEEQQREEEEERCAVCEWLVRGVSEDLHIEMIEGLRYRRWVPGEEERDAWSDDFSYEEEEDM